MVRFQTGKPVVVFGGMKTKPELNPPVIGVHGFWNVDWVMVWFPGDPVNMKVTTEPLVALMLGGVNWRGPPEVVESAPT